MLGIKIEDFVSALQFETNCFVSPRWLLQQCDLMA